MIETYKLVTNKYDQNVEKLLELEDVGRTRGHNMKIKKQRFKTDVGKFNFRNRIANIWNNLPRKVVEAPSINSFKNRLDKLWKKEDMYYEYAKVYDYEHNIIPTNLQQLYPATRTCNMRK